jgi:hypothetical protein
VSDSLHRLGDRMDDALAEILELYPRLAAALERDAGTAEGERVTTSTNVHILPVNLDVMAAINALYEQVWPAAEAAREALGEPMWRDDIPKTLASIGVLYRRLVGRQLRRPARVLAIDVFRWHYLMRRAVGLSTPDRPLRGNGRPIHCPLHDDPLVQLHQYGDEGRIDPTARGDREAIVWQRGGGLHCRHCGGAWGPSEYAFLGRLVAAQRHRINPKASA